MLHRLCEGSQIGLRVETHDDYMSGLRGTVVQESRDTLTYGIDKASSSIRVQFDQESLSGMNDWQRKIWDEVGRGDPERADKRWVWSKDCTVIETERVEMLHPEYCLCDECAAIRFALCGYDD